MPEGTRPLPRDKIVTDEVVTPASICASHRREAYQSGPIDQPNKISTEDFAKPGGHNEFWKLPRA